MKNRNFFGLCKMVFWVSFTLCGFVSADTIFMKNGDTLENVTLAEITPTNVKYKVGERAVVYTILKNNVSKIVYNDGAEDVFEVQAQDGQIADTADRIVYVYNQSTSPEPKNNYVSLLDIAPIRQVTRNDKQNRIITSVIRNDETNTNDTFYIMNSGKMLRYEPSVYSRYIKQFADVMHNYMVSAGYSSEFGFNLFVNYVTQKRERLYRENTLNSDRAYLLNLGIGFVEKSIFALSLDMKISLLESNDLNILYGLSSHVSWRHEEVAVSLDFLYKQWLLSLGVSVYFDWVDDGDIGTSLNLNAGYFIKEIAKRSELPTHDIITHKKQNSAQKRYFRPGIEVNYPVYRSEIEFFNNEFPYATGSAGLFFRIGPDNVYFTTGAYAKLDYLWRDSVVSAQLKGPFGITIARLPLLDISWQKISVEVPALVSFGAGQIRFSGGMLFDFYAVSEFDVTVNENVPIIGGQNVISANDAETLEERFDEAPTGSMYVALGLDFDIVKHWGLGVKCLILTNSFGETDSYKGFKPAAFQTRVSTYFVF